MLQQFRPVKHDAQVGGEAGSSTAPLGSPGGARVKYEKQFYCKETSEHAARWRARSLPRQDAR